MGRLLRRTIRCVLCSVLASLGGLPVQAQTIRNPDFEDGLDGWTAHGDAFAGQPAAAGTLSIDVLQPVTLGGTYWRGLPYPLGQHGDHLVRSSPRGTGTLTSSPFRIRPDDAFLSVRVGGTSDAAKARVELQVAGDGVAPGQDAPYVVTWHAAGRGPAQLQQEVFSVPAVLRGRAARIVVVDASSDEGATISVDAIAFSPSAPPAFHPPIWGVGDYHTHPMNYMAFGGLNGIRTVWGVPGGAYRDYEMIPDLIDRDMPQCMPGHAGGPSAELFIDSAEGRLVATGNGFQKLMAILRHGLTHKRKGASTFSAFPSFRTGLHYQMHITQVHRAWTGGLRLMTAIAVHNQGVEFVMSPLVGGRTNPTRERAVLDAQVCGMRQLAALNHDWMEIAYAPAQAREIISRGKLAVVLGAEFDEFGRLDGFDSIEAEVQYLWDLGIRQMTPIHAVDNRLGGAAVFQPVYNSLNDLLNRGVFNVKDTVLDQIPPYFFDVTEGGCTAGPLRGRYGECVLYTLDATQARGAITKIAGLVTAPFLVDRQASFPAVSGMLNVRGLTADGRAYLRSLMKHGMLVGLEHMSQRSVDDTYALLGQDLDERGWRECAGIGRTQVPDSCFDEAYPLEFSHAHMRHMSLQMRDANSIEGYLPSEYEVSDHEAAMLRRTGGFVGHFVAEDPVDMPPIGPALPFENDCGGSSKTFAASLLYALDRMGGAGVGLATDFTIIEGTAPRFGTHACWGARDDIEHKGKASPVPTQHGKPQEHRVKYRPARGANAAAVPDEAIEPYRMGKRVYDYNEDGLAHYGLLPDFFQDLTNIGLPQTALASLFASAEDYVRTWEKAERVSGITPAMFAPKVLPCEVACRGLCPESPNAGAPHRGKEARR